MTYRDDHEAALERVDALEREVAELRADDASQADRVAYLEESLADARRARDRAQTALAKLQPTPAPHPAAPKKPAPVPAAPAPTSSTSAVGLVIAGLLALTVLIGLAIAHDHTHDDPPRPAPKPQPVLPASADPTARLIAEALHDRLPGKLPGGFLERITITAIDESGTIHSEYDGGLRVQFERRQPAPPPPPPRPIGAPPAPAPANDGYACLVMSHDTAGWVDLDYGPLCDTSFGMSLNHNHDEVTAPRCTPSAIWKLARADGAAAGAIASLTYDGSWAFEIRDAQAPFDHRYEDNCTPAP